MPWPTCTLTVGSGAGFYTMLRLAAYKTSLDRAIKQGKRHSSSIIVYLKHTDFFYSVVKQKKKKGKNTKGLLRQESRKPALEGEDYAGST